MSLIYSANPQSTSVYAYPSSNATDGGQRNTEYNLAGLTYQITRNNYVTSTTAESYTSILSLSGDILTISPIECVIDGYTIKLDEIGINLSSIDNNDDRVLIYIKIIKESDYEGVQPNLLGDMSDNDSDATKVLAKGVAVELNSSFIRSADYLLLGWYDVADGLKSVHTSNSTKVTHEIGDIYCRNISNDPDYYISLVDYIDQRIEEKLEEFRIYSDSSYLSKVHDDVALGKIKLAEGLVTTNITVANNQDSTFDNNTLSLSTDDSSSSSLSPYQLRIGSDVAVYSSEDSKGSSVWGGGIQLASDTTLKFINSKNKSSSVYLRSDELGSATSLPQLTVTGDVKANHVYNAVWCIGEE